MNDYSVFIDLSNMNVLIHNGMKFSVAMNYSNALERLGSMLSSIGRRYNIYLCLKGRPCGEGNYVIDRLSMSGAPFCVDASEILKVLKYFHSCNGVNEVYLCNWLNNYVECARTSTFDSVFYYGNRVGYARVENHLLSAFQLFGNPTDFEESIGQGYNGYGDLGLIDVDG